MATLSKKLLFVINPISGDKDKHEFAKTVPELVKSMGNECYFIETTGKNDQQRIKNKIKEVKPDIVVAVGGDGTCNLLAHILAETSIILAIIPMGSANGMATELQVPADPLEALELLSTGKTRAIDVLVINKKYKSIHLSDIGINAKLVYLFEKDPNRGLKTYAKLFFKQLLKWKRYKIELLYDSARIRRNVISLTFANARKFGTGAIINPNGKLDDGKFELCLLKPFPWYFFLDVAVRFFKGTIQHSSFTEIIPCKHAIVRSKRSMLLQVDGEIVGKFKEIEVEILKGGLKVIVPNDPK